MNTAKQIPLMSLKEYEATSEDEHIEVYEGIPFTMAAPSITHQRLVTRLNYLFTNYILSNNGTCETFVAPCDVILSEHPFTIVQPDLFIICDPSKLDKKRCNGAPDFIIEIVSPSTASNDYIQKLFFYKKYGVKEYWIIDADRQTITVYDLVNDICNEQYTFDDKVKVGIYDDLWIDFSSLKSLL